MKKNEHFEEKLELLKKNWKCWRKSENFEDKLNIFKKTENFEKKNWNFWTKMNISKWKFWKKMKYLEEQMKTRKLRKTMEIFRLKKKSENFEKKSLKETILITRSFSVDLDISWHVIMTSCDRTIISWLVIFSFDHSEKTMTWLTGSSLKMTTYICHMLSQFRNSLRSFRIMS